MQGEETGGKEKEKELDQIVWLGDVWLGLLRRHSAGMYQFQGGPWARSTPSVQAAGNRPK
jgi:hypothetical protein